MSAPLNSDEVSEYTRVIDHILKTSDLSTVSRKKVRKGLETELGKDLSDQKDAIKVLIEQRFDAINDISPTEAMPTPPHHPNGFDSAPKHKSHGVVKREADNDDDDDDDDEDEDDDNDDGISNEIKVSTAPSKKRSSSMVEDEDARLARELQAQENQMARGRQTRGGSSKPRAKAPKKKKAKSSAKVKAGDDSDVDSDGSGGTPKKRKAGGGFMKEFNLSYPLQELVGAERLSRPQVVKKLWEHIKANDLQEPGDKRQIRCDERMQAVFKIPSVNMFKMNKFIGEHLYPLEEENADAA